MHEYRLPMRWADLDTLNHVNNTVYVTYADEARGILADAGDLPALPIRRLAVEFHKPMPLTHRSVVVRSALDGDSLRQEVCSAVDDSPVFATITSEFAGLRSIEPSGITAGRFPLRVRRADMAGAGGTATCAKLVEYVQEARVVALAKLFMSGVLGSSVVAAVDLESAAPIAWRPEPYEAFTSVLTVGRSSYTMLTEVRDGDAVLVRSTAVLVAFDADTQSSRTLTEDERTGLQSLMG